VSRDDKKSGSGKDQGPEEGRAGADPAPDQDAPAEPPRVSRRALRRSRPISVIPETSDVEPGTERRRRFFTRALSGDSGAQSASGVRRRWRWFRATSETRPPSDLTDTEARAEAAKSAAAELRSQLRRSSASRAAVRPPPLPGSGTTKRGPTVSQPPPTPPRRSEPRAPLASERPPMRSLPETPDAPASRPATSDAAGAGPSAGPASAGPASAASAGPASAGSAGPGSAGPASAASAGPASAASAGPGSAGPASAGPAPDQAAPPDPAADRPAGAKAPRAAKGSRRAPRTRAGRQTGAVAGQADARKSGESRRAAGSEARPARPGARPSARSRLESHLDIARRTPLALAQGLRRWRRPLTDLLRPPAWQRHDLLVVALAAAVFLAGAIAQHRLAAPALLPMSQLGLQVGRPSGWLPPRRVGRPTGGLAARADVREGVSDLDAPDEPASGAALPYHVVIQSALDPVARLEIRVAGRPAAGNLRSALVLERVSRHGEAHWEGNSTDRTIGGRDWVRTEYRYAYKASKADAPRIATGIEYAIVNGRLLYTVTIHGGDDTARRLEKLLVPTLSVDANHPAAVGGR
jgi:hypothetical protein